MHALERRRKVFYEKLLVLKRRFDQQESALELCLLDPIAGTTGFLVVWNVLGEDTQLGPCAKGGCRISPSVSLGEVRMLAQKMALKNAAAGLPIGGAKSALCADPDVPEFEHAYRSFVSSLRPTFVEFGGVYGGLGFDLGARPIHAEWACRELGSTRCFTGKPVEMGGTDYDKEGIAGLGVVEAAEVGLGFEGKSLDKCSAAIQGLGAMGAGVFRYVHERGAKITHISDLRIDGTYALSIEDQEAVAPFILEQDFDALSEILTERGCKKSAPEEVLTQSCDILFPCAIQDVINRENAALIKASIVVEAANNPCTPAALEILASNQVTVIPDIIANSGGVISAYVEMTSTLTPEENAASRKNVTDAKLLTKEKIRNNTLRCLKLAKLLNVAPNQSGQFIALSRIYQEEIALQPDLIESTAEHIMTGSE